MKFTTNWQISFCCNDRNLPISGKLLIYSLSICCFSINKTNFPSALKVISLDFLLREDF
jgi:hypothetical protein